MRSISSFQSLAPFEGPQMLSLRNPQCRHENPLAPVSRRRCSYFRPSAQRTPPESFASAGFHESCLAPHRAVLNCALRLDRNAWVHGEPNDTENAHPQHHCCRRATAVRLFPFSAEPRRANRVKFGARYDSHASGPTRNAQLTALPAWRVCMHARFS